jgi:hypothetical protein
MTTAVVSMEQLSGAIVAQLPPYSCAVVSNSATD